MKLIIEIPEEVKAKIDANHTNAYIEMIAEEAIAHGTPLEDIKAEIPILSHWQTDDGQDLLMVADALECIDKYRERIE